MSPAQFVEAVVRFHSLSKVEQTLAFSWFIHVHESAEEFTVAKMRDVFRSARIEAPDFSVYLPRMVSKKPPQLIKRAECYRLNGRERRRLDGRYGANPATIAVAKLLLDLPAKVPSVEERTFLNETINCYKVGAFRATIVMAWNLAFDHVRLWILSDSARVDSFNQSLKLRFPKLAPVSKVDDFESMKEFEVVEVLKTSGLVTDNVVGVLREKLQRRNRVAHPSSIVVTQYQADETVTDLVNNVVLRLT